MADHLLVANGVIYDVFNQESAGGGYTARLMAWRADTGRQLLALSLTGRAYGLSVAAGRVNLSLETLLPNGLWQWQSALWSYGI